MIWAAYFAVAVFLAYRFGRDNAGVGVAVFLAFVAVWQLINDGPSSFLENDCTRYSSYADDC